MDNYSDDKINIIIEAYNKKKQYEKDRYNNFKNDDDFILKNRSRAKDYYNKNRDTKLKHYHDNKEILNAKSSYYYFKRNNKLDIFNEKKTDKYELLKSIDFI